jgi:arginine:ornithine antiporter / lysine permease
LFLLLGLVVVGSLDRATIAVSDASMADLLRLTVGNAAAQVGALMAIILLFLLMLTWTRSGGRLIVALARDGLFPARLRQIDAASGSPRAALLALAGAWLVAMILYVVVGTQVETFIQLSSANFLATYVLIFAAAWRLLSGGALRWALVVASLAVVVLVAASLPSMWYAAATTAVFAVVTIARRTLAVRAARSH